MYTQYKEWICLLLPGPPTTRRSFDVVLSIGFEPLAQLDEIYIPDALRGVMTQAQTPHAPRQTLQANMEGRIVGEKDG